MTESAPRKNGNGNGNKLHWWITGTIGVVLTTLIYGWMAHVNEAIVAAATHRASWSASLAETSTDIANVKERLAVIQADVKTLIVQVARIEGSGKRESSP